MAEATEKQTRRRKGDTARELEAELRRQKAFDLFKSGVTNCEVIGRILKEEAKKEGRSTRGYSAENIRLDIKAVRSERRKEFEQEVEDWRTDQLERLSEQYLTFNALAKGRVNPDTGRREPNIEAGRLALKILQEINTITGVRAAVKVEHSGADGVDLIPKDLSITINSIYGGDFSSTTEGIESNDSGG